MREAPALPPHRSPPPPSGVHRFGLRVYWEDTDGGGIVYHAGYLRFAERARTELLRRAGIGQQELLEASGVAFAVRRMTIDFRAPARLDDWLEVTTGIAEMAQASLRLSQSIARDDRILVDLDVQLACLDRRGRAVRLPAGLRDAFAAPAAGNTPLDRAAAPRQEPVISATSPNRD